MSEIRNSKSHTVYAIHTSGYPEWVKIGKAGSSIYDRVRTLNQAHPQRNLRCDFFIYDEQERGHDIEQDIHQRIDDSFKREGEWFQLGTYETARFIFQKVVDEWPGAIIVDIKDELAFTERRQKHEKYMPKGINEIKRLIEHNGKEK